MTVDSISCCQIEFEMFPAVTAFEFFPQAMFAAENKWLG